MAQQYDSMVTSDTVPPGNDPLLAGSNMPTTFKAITIATGQAKLLRGQIMAGTPAAAVAYAGDPAVAIGILAQDMKAAATDDVQGSMWVTGEFNEAMLTGLDAAAITQLEALNVYPRRVDP
jgi:hypothetical protein